MCRRTDRKRSMRRKSEAYVNDCKRSQGLGRGLWAFDLSLELAHLTYKKCFSLLINCICFYHCFTHLWASSLFQDITQPPTSKPYQVTLPSHPLSRQNLGCDLTALSLQYLGSLCALSKWWETSAPLERLYRLEQTFPLLWDFIQDSPWGTRGVL